MDRIIKRTLVFKAINIIKKNTMKKTLFFTLAIFPLMFLNCTSGNSRNEAKDSTGTEAVSQLTADAFKKVVYNYDVDKTWKYEGNMPAVIDFYADWCPPCRQLSPLVEEVAKEYKGKIVVFRVNTDKEKELTQSLGITNLPTLLYIPVKGQPKVTLGYISKDILVKTINEILLTK